MGGTQQQGEMETQGAEGTGVSLANKSRENQSVGNVAAGSGSPERGQNLSAATTVHAEAREAWEEQEVQRRVQEEAEAELRNAEAWKWADLEKRRSALSPESIAAREEAIRVIHERRAAKEARIDAEKRSLAGWLLFFHLWLF
jgi:hypothetical protein